jgi:ATP-binding cassette, subfamily B, bacterial
VQLFNASVRDNLTFFNRAIDDARLLQVIDAVGLSMWYQTLPSGLDSMLGADGQGLSAGEAQLLAFARVFLKDPGLVIFDEASSRLDPATERLIERAVSSILINRTGIVIAHRLTTIQRADDILILEDGRIREYGPREVLAADAHSRFSHLLSVGLEEVRA